MSKVRDFWVAAALTASLAAVAWFAFAALGTKFGVIDWRIGFGLMTFRWGGMVTLGALGIAAIGLILSLAVPPRRRGLAMALVALAIPGAMLGYAGMTRANLKDVPPIHDATTDLADPPQFSAAAVAARESAKAANDLDLLGAVLPERAGAFGGRKVVDVHREKYGDLKPLISEVPPTDLFEIAVDAASAQPGWTVVRMDPVSGMIEAEAHSFWYGFVDDIVIRIRPIPDGTGSIVDMRSVSRVGMSDLGANAKRIRGYMTDLSKRLEGAATGG